MRQAVRWAARLYPAAWRARYGAEFEALMEDMEPRWRDVWNVAGGALQMQMTMWTGWKLLAALGAAGAIAMAVAAFAVRPVYESSAVVQETPTVISEGLRDAVVAEGMESLGRKIMTRGALAGIVGTEKLYPGETVEEGVARMRGNIRISAPVLGNGHPSSALVISFRYPDAAKAQRVVTKLVDLMMEGNLAVPEEGRLAYQMELLDAPRTPNRPIFPNRPLMMAAGLMAGLLLGVLYCARKGWKVVLCCGALGAPLGVYGFALALGRHVPQSEIQPLAIMGFVAGLAIGSVAVMLRRKPLAG